MNNQEFAFEHDGFLCVGLGVDLGHRCGYVLIPRGHPWYRKKGLDSPDVHGGITFTEIATRDGKKGWWIGFDCGHYMDGKDVKLMSYHMLEAMRSFPVMSGGKIRTQLYVEEECRRLATQAKEAV